MKMNNFAAVKKSRNNSTLQNLQLCSRMRENWTKWTPTSRLFSSVLIMEYAGHDMEFIKNVVLFKSCQQLLGPCERHSAV